jgi:hypothetical protein
MQRPVVRRSWRDVSEQHVVSIFRDEEQEKQETRMKLVASKAATDCRALHSRRQKSS